MLVEAHSPLAAYLDWLEAVHPDEAEFLILFGSRARGDALEDSDYDLLLGLRQEDGRRLIDRLGVFGDTLTGKVQVFPYTPSEIEQMFGDAHLLLLEALADGIPLIDRGRWAELQQRFARRVEAGSWRRVAGGWEVAD